MMRPRRSLPMLVLVSAVVFSCAGSKNVTGGGLWGTLGGVTGVSALSSSFGRNLAADAVASQALGMAGIDAAKRGLYNSIAKTGGYGPEKGSDLLSVLKGKKLDASAVNAIGSSLTKAGEEQKLDATNMAGLKGLWEPMAKTLGS